MNEPGQVSAVNHLIHAIRIFCSEIRTLSSLYILNIFSIVESISTDYYVITLDHVIKDIRIETLIKELP